MITGMPRIAIAVRDFEAAVSMFRDKLGLPVIDLSASSVESLGANLAMCVPEGGSNIELMCPANPDAPLSQSLQRFLDRRGEGLFALMLEAPSPDDEGERLAKAGLNVLPLMAGAGGRDIHPRSTHGVLIRIYPTNSFKAQRATGDETLALSGIVRVLIAVRDLDDAMAVYGEKLGLALDPPVVNTTRGVKSVVCHPPSGGVIELVSVVDEQRPFAATIDAWLQQRGEGLFALVMQTDEPARAAAVLSGRGLTTTSKDGHPMEIAPTDTFGARVWLQGNRRQSA